MQVVYVSNVTRPRDAILHRASWYKQMLKPLVLVKSFQYLPHKQVLSVICRIRSHSWLCIPGLLFLVIQYKLIFSYQRSRPVLICCVNNIEQTGSRLSSFCRFFEHNTNVTICPSCQRMSSLTAGFKICVYLDRYSNVLAQTSHMFCM